MTSEIPLQRTQRFGESTSHSLGDCTTGADVPDADAVGLVADARLVHEHGDDADVVADDELALARAVAFQMHRAAPLGRGARLDLDAAVSVTEHVCGVVAAMTGGRADAAAARCRSSAGKSWISTATRLFLSKARYFVVSRRVDMMIFSSAGQYVKFISDRWGAPSASVDR